MNESVRRCRIALVAVLAILIVAVDATAKDFKIIGGERIGAVSLGMFIDGIQKLLGSPSRVERAPGSILYEWQSRLIRVHKSLNSDDIVSVRTFRVYGNPNPYRTEKGLGVGSTEQEVKQGHSKAGCFLDESAEWREYWWPDAGISYYVSMSQFPQAIQFKVGEIGVRLPQVLSPGPPYKRCQ